MKKRSAAGTEAPPTPRSARKKMSEDDGAPAARKASGKAETAKSRVSFNSRTSRESTDSTRMPRSESAMIKQTSSQKSTPDHPRYRNFADRTDDSQLASPRQNRSDRGVIGSGMSATSSRGKLESFSGSYTERGRVRISVIIRVRPALKGENVNDDIITCAPDGKTLQLEGDERSKTVTVDEVVDSREAAGTQEEVYARVGKTLVQQALKDFNVCIFAYGHTGSGKTHTMLGKPGERGEQAGLIPRVVGELFRSHADLPTGSSTQYSCEFYEVYNETIRDLLAPTHVQGQDRKRTVHVHPKHGVRVDGLSTSVVKDAQEAQELVLFGNQMRTVAATTMNAESSRSHAIFTFKFTSEVGKEHHSSVITFVDLAGREDQAASRNKEMQFREMTYINTSLFHLSHLITKLSDGNSTKGSLADFRNSKLTLLLSQALIGNCSTVLMATLAPSREHFEDSLSTVMFAQQVKRIKTRPMTNNKMANDTVKELEDELERLKRELLDAKSSNTEVEQELHSAQALLKHFKGSTAELQASSSQARLTRQRVSIKLGLGAAGVTGYHVPKSESGEPLPFLTKLSNDESLQGCCNYFLVKPVIRIGSHEECDIVTQGVGIRPLMCSVKHKPDKTITVSLHGEGSPDSQCDTSESQCSGDESWNINEAMTRMSSWNINEAMTPQASVNVTNDEDFPRVLVNGTAIKPEGDERVLQHGDCIILGYAHAYRLVIPTREDLNMDAQSMARRRLSNMEVSIAMQEVDSDGGDQYLEVLPMLRQLNSNWADSALEGTKKTLNTIGPMIDEANQITAEIFGAGTLYFKLHMLMDMFCEGPPVITVAVIADANADQNVIRSDGQQPTSFLNANWERKRKSKSSPTALGRSSILPGERERRMSSGQNSNSNSSLGIGSVGLSDLMVVNANKDKLLFVWTLNKFQRRLHEMRSMYQGGTYAQDGFAAVRQELRNDLFANPWREPAFADVRLLSERARRVSLQTVPEARSHEGLGAPSPSASPPPSPRKPNLLQAEVSLGAAARAELARKPLDNNVSLTSLAPEDLCPNEEQRGISAEVECSPNEAAFNGLEAFAYEELPLASSTALLSSSIDDNMAESISQLKGRGRAVEAAAAKFQNSLEVQKLRQELAACRTAPDQDPDDFTSLLDRLEGLVDHLSQCPSWSERQRRERPAGRAPSPKALVRVASTPSVPPRYQYQMPVARRFVPTVPTAVSVPAVYPQQAQPASLSWTGPPARVTVAPPIRLLAREPSPKRAGGQSSVQCSLRPALLEREDVPRQLQSLPGSFREHIYPLVPGSPLVPGRMTPREDRPSLRQVMTPSNSLVPAPMLSSVMTPSTSLVHTPMPSSSLAPGAPRSLQGSARQRVASPQSSPAVPVHMALRAKAPVGAAAALPS